MLTDTWVTHDASAAGYQNRTLVRHGSLVDVKPGSALEAAYGAGNLSGLLAPIGDEPCASKGGTSN